MRMLRCSVPVGLFVVATVLLSVGVQSAEIPERGPIPFAAYDRDGNGRIDAAEFNAVRGERMATLAAQRRPMSGADEAPGFTTFDTNGDGQLSPEELAAGERAQMEKRRVGGWGQGRGMGPGGAGNRPSYADYDLNGDGKIVEKEFYQARNQRISERVQQGYQMRNLGNAPSFAEIDTNGDGELSAAEFNTHQFLRGRQNMQ